MSFEALEWKDGRVRMLDQTRLPHEEVYHSYDTPEQVADAIRRLVIRGAPAIGNAAAMGLVLGANRAEVLDARAVIAAVERDAALLAATRPTAVNLFGAIERMKRVAHAHASRDVASLRRLLFDECEAIRREDAAANRAMGAHGEPLMPEKGAVLTHCNTGALATAGWGTAIGVLRTAVEVRGKDITVYATETRPFLQGARLTAWELMQLGIEVVLITDGMAGHYMHEGVIDAVIVGADRVAANGDVANKIGTYTLAVLARENGIPFYVAAPSTTLDFDTEMGDDIEIEERDPEEVTHVLGQRIAPAGVRAGHPAFDVTPNRYVTAIITERGVAKPPYRDTLRRLVAPK